MSRPQRVGILISGALLISDWVRRLLPQGSLRRKHHVVIGTYGAIAETVDAAGYHLEEPWFLSRGLRERRTYLLLACGLKELVHPSSSQPKVSCVALIVESTQASSVTATVPVI